MESAYLELHSTSAFLLDSEAEHWNHMAKVIFIHTCSRDRRRHPASERVPPSPDLHLLNKIQLGHNQKKSTLVSFRST